MKFLILDIYKNDNWRLVKDTAGGYGTGNDFGNSFFSVKDLKEVIYASTFTVKYIIVEKNIAKHAQEIVNNYMLDSKILIIITSDDEIVENALDEIDGVIYQKVVNNETE